MKVFWLKEEKKKQTCRHSKHNIHACTHMYIHTPTQEDWTQSDNPGENKRRGGGEGEEMVGGVEEVGSSRFPPVQREFLLATVCRGPWISVTHILQRKERAQEIKEWLSSYGLSFHAVILINKHVQSRVGLFSRFSAER